MPVKVTMKLGVDCARDCRVLSSMGLVEVDDEVPVNSATYPLLAIVYSDGLAADQLISSLGYKLRDAGIAVAGIVQHNRFVRDRTKCDMAMEELSSGITLKLSEDRGKEARGCRLDRSALSKAAFLLSAAIAREPELVILNKFGKTEAEGHGLRDALAQAVELGIPVLVGVPIAMWSNGESLPELLPKNATSAPLASINGSRCSGLACLR